MNTTIIAEAGVNHNGCIKTAIDMVNEAAHAGADVIKFQCFKAKDLVNKMESKANYQKKTTNARETQYEMLKKLELTENDFKKLAQHSQAKGIRFLATPFSASSAEFLYNLNLDLVKISSGDITDRPLLEVIAQKEWDIIFSTGMSSISEIDEAFKILSQSGNSNNEITILLCTSQYPTPYNDINLNAMRTLSQRYKVDIGLSDHSVGIHVPIAAVALGACVIEKHFTLDKCMPGPDHNASIDVKQLKQMVSEIRDIEESLGSFDISLRDSEFENYHKARKSIVANCDIKSGDRFSFVNLTTMRPGTGISPMDINRLIGVASKKDYRKHEIISLVELKEIFNG